MTQSTTSQSLLTYYELFQIDRYGKCLVSVSEVIEFENGSSDIESSQIHSEQQSELQLLDNN